jgi:hypothetical protein
MSLAVAARVLLLTLAEVAPAPSPSPSPVPVPVTAPPAAAETILWFGATGPGVDGVALLNAVTVYTRDLRLAVEVADPTPPPADAADAAAPAAILRARRARLGFWCEAHADRRTIVITTVDRGARVESHAVENAAAGEPDLYRAIALKVRTVVVAAVGMEVLTAPRPPAPPEIETPPTVVATVVPLAEARPTSAPSRPALLFALGYRFSAPLGTAPLRNAAWAEAGLRLGRLAELALDVEVAPRSTGTAGAGSVSVFDLPIALAGRLVARRGRWAAGGGAFVAAHLLWASGNATDFGGAQADAFTLAGGVGLEALARVRLGGRFTGELEAYAEAGLPNTWFWVRETPTLEIGSRVGVAAGLAFPGL